MSDKTKTQPPPRQRGLIVPPLPTGDGKWPIWLHEAVWFCTANQCPAVMNGLPV